MGKDENPSKMKVLENIPINYSQLNSTRLNNQSNIIEKTININQSNIIKQSDIIEQLNINEQFNINKQSKNKNNIKHSKNLRIKAYLQKNWISLFSHHPPCSHFQDHTFRIGKYHFCIGCYIGYPAGFLGILLGNIILLQNWLLNIVLLIFGLIGFVLGYIPSFFHWIHRKPLKMLQKFIIGISGGILLFSIYKILPVSPFFKFLNTFFAFNIIMAPVFLKHYFSMRNICDTCPDKWNPEKCPVKFCLAKRPSSFSNSSNFSNSFHNSHTSDSSDSS
ncbi:MAG: hypothetical protein K9W44_01255 [Candidatus Lokiarchaeota archaeon]|nr:hypothetical protein [Candidatus Harpocratesius repetitus]